MSVWKKLLAADGKPSKQPASDNPWDAAARDAQPTSLHEGFDSARRSRRGAGAWTWAKRIAVGMLLLAGFIQLVIKPVRNVLTRDDAPPAEAAQVSVAAAEATATGFALDYLSSAGPAGDAQRSAALERWLYPDAFGQASDVGTWTGDAVLIADAATVQSVALIGKDAAVVAVQARVRTFVPGSGGPSSSATPPAPQETGSPAFIPQVPAGYVTGPAYWVRLVVPTMQSDARVLVAAPGPVFSADDVTPVAVTVESDARQNERLMNPVKKILEAYAAGDLQYVAAADSELLGMDGSLTVATISKVRVSSVDNDNGSRNVAADVEWTLAGTTATITQTYGLQLSDVDAAAPQLEHISVLKPSRPEDN